MDTKHSSRLVWQKMGHVFSCDFYGTGYAQDAFFDTGNPDAWRVYYSTRTQDVVSLPYVLDVEAGNPQHILGAC